MLLAELLYKGGDLPEMAPRKPREEVVLDLELEPAMEPVHPRRALDIEGPTGLLLEPVITGWWTQVDTRREVVEAELDVLDPCDNKARNHEHDPLPPTWQTGNEQRVPNPEHEET